MQVLGEQRQLGDSDRDLALLGAENLALDTDDVADVELLVALVYVLADVVALDIELKAAVAVGMSEKDALPMMRFDIMRPARRTVLPSSSSKCSWMSVV